MSHSGITTHLKRSNRCKQLVHGGKEQEITYMTFMNYNERGENEYIVTWCKKRKKVCLQQGKPKDEERLTCSG